MSTDGQTHALSQNDFIICPMLYAIAMGQIIRVILRNFYCACAKRPYFRHISTSGIFGLLSYKACHVLSHPRWSFPPRLKLIRLSIAELQRRWCQCSNYGGGASWGLAPVVQALPQTPIIGWRSAIAIRPPWKLYDNSTTGWCGYVTWPCDLDLLTLGSGQTWQVSWATPPPSLKMLRLYM